MASTWVLVDCRFDLMDVDAGETAYLEAHIPGAVYAHLDRDLSGAPITDRGRHPLPAPEVMADTFGRLGIGPGIQVVVYDAAEGAIAARLWWMLRYMGHDEVAVLNGGWGAWDEAGRFLPPMAIRRKLKAILKDTPPGESAFYCGSGVNACQNLLALAYAGLPEARLYAGSWSDWCSYPERPVATGAEP